MSYQDAESGNELSVSINEWFIFLNSLCIECFFYKNKNENKTRKKTLVSFFNALLLSGKWIKIKQDVWMVTGKVKYVKLISFLPAQFSWLSFANRFCALSFIAKLVGISVSFLTHFRWFLLPCLFICMVENERETGTFSK